MEFFDVIQIRHSIAVQQIIGAPQGIVPVAILPIGYAAGSPRLTRRRKLSDIVHTNDA